MQEGSLPRKSIFVFLVGIYWTTVSICSVPGMNFGANLVYVCALTCYNISLSCHRVNRIGYWTCVYIGVSDLSVCTGGIFPSCMHPPHPLIFI